MERTDLFGNFTHKKQLWNYLWNTRHRSNTFARQHDDSYILFSRIQKGVKFMSGVLTSSGTLLLGVSENTQFTVGIILNMLSVFIQVMESVSGLETIKLEHKKSADNYKFIAGEVERVMATKRTTAQLSEIVESISTQINSIQQSTPNIMNFIGGRHPLTHEDGIPLVPVSPENSVSVMIDDYKNFEWSTDYPILSQKFPEYYKSCNIAHYLNDEQGSVIHVDENCCYFIGMSRNDIISPSGFGWATKIFRDDSQFVYKAWTTSVAERRVFHEKYRFIPDVDTITFCIAEAYPRYNIRGIFKGFEGILLNVPRDVWFAYEK